MKAIIYSSIFLVLSACTLTDNGVIINKPTIPQVNVCENVASDSDVTIMKEKIEAQAFKDERMQTAKMVTKGYCFSANQVVSVMQSMIFPDARLEIAKDLYDQCTDRNNYDVVVNSLVHKSDRDELREYIANHPL